MKKTLSFLIFLFLIALPITLVDMMVSATLEQHFALGVGTSLATTFVIVVASSIAAAWLWGKVEKLAFKKVVV